jgi:hypothetical protein
VPTFIAITNLTAFLALTRGVLCSQDLKKDKPLPSVEEVMDHYVTALGGHDAIFKHKSMTIRGKFELSDNRPSLDRTVYYKDGRILYHGCVATPPQERTHDPEGRRSEIKRTRRGHYYPSRIPQYFKFMEVVEVTDFEGHTCYHLKGTNKWGIVNEQFYDTTTGLLVGYKFNSSWRGGSGDESEVFSDYKGFDGWLMPTRAAHKSANGTQTETITSVSFDDVADSVFTLPDAIKSLLAKKSRG